MSATSGTAAVGNRGHWTPPIVSLLVDPAVRSKMNVVWRLNSEALEEKFVAEAKAAGMDGLKGHRSVGGCRASIYNAMPAEGAQALAQFMADFARKNG